MSKHPNCKLHNMLLYYQACKFLEKFKNLYGKSVYDLGCGEMPHKAFIMKYAEKYVGVDWSSSIHRLKADIVADLNKLLPINSEVADTVVSFSVLEHLCEPQTMLGEAYRILKSGGNIIIQVPWQWWVHEAPYDFFRYTPFGLKYLLEKAGFKEVHIEPASGFFTMWFLKLNYFSARFIIGPRLLRLLIKSLLIPVWLFLQLSAPILDKLDRNWAAEAQGYWVIAKK